MDNSKLLAAAALVGLYMYLNRQTPQGQATSGGGSIRPATMPASAGTGLNQVQAGAISGFFQSILNSTRNNSTSGYPYYSETGNGVVNGGGLSENFPIMQENFSGDDAATGWVYA